MQTNHLSRTADIFKDGQVICERALVELHHPTASGWLRVKTGVRLTPGEHYQLVWPDKSVETIIIQEVEEMFRPPNWEKFLLVTDAGQQQAR